MVFEVFTVVVMKSTVFWDITPCSTLKVNRRFGVTYRLYLQGTVGFEVLTAVAVKSTIFWDITPCSTLKVNRRFGATYRLHLQGRRISRAELCLPAAFLLVSCSSYSSTLKMEAICSSVTSVDFQRITRRYISEDSDLQDQCLIQQHIWHVAGSNIGRDTNYVD
jgi:hypothetical protein